LVVLPILWDVRARVPGPAGDRPAAQGSSGVHLGQLRRGVHLAGFWTALRTTLLFSVVGTVASIGLGLVAALALRRGSAGADLVRASMLLPYVAPVVAVTFVWQTMLNPQFGVVNAVGQVVFGWDDPVAFLSQRSAPVSVFGVEIDVPVALLTVMAFEIWRYFPFAFLFLTAASPRCPGTSRRRRWWTGRRSASASATWCSRSWCRRRLARGAAVHLHLQRVRRHLPAHRGAAGTRWPCVRVYDLLTARGDIGAASAQALVLAGVLVGAAGGLLQVRRPAGERGGVHRRRGAHAGPAAPWTATGSRTRVRHAAVVVIAVLVLGDAACPSTT
jgi:multiple sugar transport system permease protein